MSYKDDDPIEHFHEDRLDRSEFAKGFSNSIKQAPFEAGYVISLTGKWGSGKSSILNLAKKDLEKSNLVLMDFSPWLLSSPDKILIEFMHQLQVAYLSRGRLRFRYFAYRLGKYAKLVIESGKQVQVSLPLVDIVDQSVRFIFRFVVQMAFRKKSLEEIRDKIQKKLVKTNVKVVVFMDDIDRLQQDEILLITKIVKLIADFPNIVYVLAYDQEIVKEALNLNNYSGEEYLRKIVQQPVALPDISNKLLTRYTLESLDAMISEYPDQVVFDEQRWANIYWEIVSPNLKSLRDVKRVLNGVRFALNRFGARINLVDLVALETLRLYRQEILSGLVLSKELLHTPKYGPMFTGEQHENDARRKKLYENFPTNDKEYTDAVLKQLFPATASYLNNMHFGNDPRVEWLGIKRVAVKEVFDLFLTGIESEELFVKEQARLLFEKHKVPEEFHAHLASFSGSQLSEILDSLTSYRGKFEPSKLAEIILSVFEKLKEMDNLNSGMFGLGKEDVVRRLVTSMLLSVRDRVEFEDICESLYSQLDNFSLRNIYVYAAVSSASDSEALKPYAAELKQRFQTEILNLSVAELMNEVDFMSILHSAPQFVINHEADYEFLKKVFLNSVGSSKYTEFDSRTIKTFQSASWSSLIFLFGTEAKAVDKLEWVISQTPLQETDRAKLEWILTNRGGTFPGRE